MKKSKIGVFAVLGALSISAVAVGVTVTSQKALSPYDATVPCTLTWKAGQGLTLDAGGSGTFINGHVETAYQNASIVNDAHVQLGLDGYVQTSKKAWDGAVGGYVNGLTSLTVSFETTAFYDDSVLLLSAGFNETGDVKSSYHIESGVEVTFDEAFLPSTFKLEYKPQSFEAIDSVAKIKTIVAKCTMVQSYGVKLTKTDTAIKYNDLIWTSGLDEATPLDGSKLNKLQLKPGDVISLRSPDDSKAYLTKDDIVVTGGTVTSKKLGQNKYDTISITCNDHLTIDIATHHEAAIYAGRDFLGTYGVIDLASKEQTTLTLDEFGTLTIGTKTYKYNADDADKITLEKTSNTFAKNGEYIRTKLDNKIYIGAKGSNITFPVLKTSGTGEYADIIAKIAIDGGTPNYVHIYRSDILISGLKDVIITEEKAGINALDVVKITTTTQQGRTAMFKQGNFNSGKAYESGDETTIYFTVSGDTLTLVEALDAAGTYTSEGNPDLVLDIFGTVSFGPLTKENAYNKEKSEVDLDNYILILDVATKTYVEKVVHNGEQWTTPTTYKLSTGEDSLTFDNGTVTLNTTKTSYTKKTATYTVENSIVRFTLQHEADYDSSLLTIPAVFELELNADKTRLKVIKAVGEDSSNSWLNITLFSKGSEFVIPVEVADPWATTPGVYSDGTLTITLQAGQITLSDKKGLEKETVPYSYDGDKLTAKFQYYDSELGLVDALLTLDVAPDLSNLIAESDLVDGAGWTASEIISAGTTYNRSSGPTA